MSNGFIKLLRNEMTETLITKKPIAFNLLTRIALRASREGNKVAGLEAGQAFIGSGEFEPELTRQQTRTALNFLKINQLITIKTTNRGTIVTLIDKEVYDINSDQSTSQSTSTPTNKQPTSNQQATTIKKGKKYFIQEVRNMGVDENLINDFLSINRKKLAVTERALNLQLKNLGEFIDRGFTAQRVFEVLAENPSWQNIKLKDYFLEALKGEEGIKDVRQQLNDDGWAVRDQSNLQNSGSRLPRISEGQDRGRCEVHEAHLAAKLV